MPAHTARQAFLTRRIGDLDRQLLLFGPNERFSNELGRLTVEKNTGQTPAPLPVPLAIASREMIPGVPRTAMQEFSPNFVHKRIGRAIGGFFEGGVVGGVGGFFSGEEEVRSPGRRIREPDCPGLFNVRIGGKCVDPTRLPPGGEPPITDPRDPGMDLVLTAGEGEPVIGAFGMPAMTPFIVGQIQDHHGNMRPIRRCIAGAVLGRDNLCYPDNLTSGFRKWRKAKRPPVSAGDAACIRKAAASVKRVKKLAESVGLKTSRRK